MSGGGRLWCTRLPEAGETLLLDEAECRHLAAQRRDHAGEPVELLDGLGRRAIARIRDRPGKRWEAEIVRVDTVPRPEERELLVPLLERARFEWLLEKAVELGVTRIAVLPCEREDRALRKGLQGGVPDRWIRILREALKQCGRAWLPRVDAAASLEEEWPRPGLLLDPEGGAAGDARATARIAVGPPGGFTASEREGFLGNGWQAVRLGGAVLRTETAAIAGLALALAAE